MLHATLRILFQRRPAPLLLAVFLISVPNLATADGAFLAP